MPLFRQARGHIPGLGKLCVLAREISSELDEPLFGFAACRDNPLQFLLEPVAGVAQPLQLCGRGSLFGAEWR